MFIAEKSSTAVEKASSKVTNFDINLDNYDSAEKLESLGLDHLKHALEGFFKSPLKDYFIFRHICYFSILFRPNIQ